MPFCIKLYPLILFNLKSYLCYQRTHFHSRERVCLWETWSTNHRSGENRSRQTPSGGWASLTCPAKSTNIDQTSKNCTCNLMHISTETFTFRNKIFKDLLLTCYRHDVHIERFQIAFKKCIVSWVNISKHFSTNMGPKMLCLIVSGHFICV